MRGMFLFTQSLFAYHIDALVGSYRMAAITSRRPIRVDRDGDVDFFNVGTLQDRTLLIYKKKTTVCNLSPHFSLKFTQG